MNNQQPNHLCVCSNGGVHVERKRGREGGREGERERQTDRQRQRDRHTDRQSEMKRDTKMADNVLPLKIIHSIFQHILTKQEDIFIN